MKAVFLTGGSGFVGSHVAKLFLQDNWNVRALVRRPDRAAALPPGVEPVVADLLQPEKFGPALAGCDAVVHVAGLVKARTLAEYMQANADGAEAVVRAASLHAPQAMFVLVSSQAAAGPSRDGRPVQETDSPNPISWYGRSKLEGERRVIQLAKNPWCIVRPSVVYGSGDPGLLELFKSVQGPIAPLPAGGRGRVQLIGVEDLARVLVRAATRPDLSGRCGFAAGSVVTVRELIAFVASLRKKRPWLVPVPSWAVRTAGAWESLRQRVTRQARPFNWDKAKEMLQPHWVCDADPFLRDLGLSDLAPWKEGLEATCRCYVADGWLRPDVWGV